MSPLDSSFFELFELSLDLGVGQQFRLFATRLLQLSLLAKKLLAVAYPYALNLINDVFDDVEFVRNLVGIRKEFASHPIVVWSHITGYARDCKASILGDL